MTLWIHQNGREDQVLNDLFIISGDNALSMRADGLVTYNQTRSSVGADMIGWLHNAGQPVIIRGEETAFYYHPEWSLEHSGGEAVADRYPFTNYAHIVYDVTNCGGRRSWVEGISGDPIRSPTHVALFHEMVHVHHWLTFSEYPPDPEAQAIGFENEYRRELGMPQRGSHRGGCGPGPGGCFIATASYGSANNANVQLLRRFRDQVLRKTLTGFDFFQRFYEHYYQFSPLVVEQMKKDPAAKELIRVSLVEPIVKFFKLFLEMPNSSLENVPSPWREYLELTLFEYENWAKQVDLPTDFSKMEGIEAVSELAIVVKYALRRDGEREEYISELNKAGQIPIRLPQHQLQMAVTILQEAGLQKDLIKRLVQEAPALMAYRNGTHAFLESSLTQYAYSVVVINNTSDTFSEITVFYDQHSGALTMERIVNVGPGNSVTFNLGPCIKLKSYAIGFFIGNEMVFRHPPEGFNMTPQLASEIHPEDVNPCADSWELTEEIL